MTPQIKQVRLWAFRAELRCVCRGVACYNMIFFYLFSQFLNIGSTANQELSFFSVLSSIKSIAIINCINRHSYLYSKYSSFFVSICGCNRSVNALTTRHVDRLIN